MNVIVLLLTISLVVALVFLGAFIWNVRSGQYDDDYSPAHRIFFEDEIKKKTINNHKNNQ